MKNMRVVFFIILIFFQLAVPAYMIIEQEIVLQSGTLFKMKTKPVDPYDVFRGRYIHLSFEIEAVTGEISDNIKENSSYNTYPLYVSFLDDKDGFAIVSDAAKDKPDHGKYILVKKWNKYNNNWRNKKEEGKVLNLTFPFDRFYMNEDIAQIAEEKYNGANLRNSKKRVEAYAAVRIKDGMAVIENVFLDNMSISDYVKKHTK